MHCVCVCVCVLVLGCCAVPDIVTDIVRHTIFQLVDHEDVCRYAVGDETKAETCDSFCSRSGQGHLHFCPCDKSKCESDAHDNIKHETDPEIVKGHGAPVDAYSHQAYWEHLNIEDPCMPEERQAFAKCGKLCASDVHQQARRSTCCAQLDLPHKMFGTGFSIMVLAITSIKQEASAFQSFHIASLSYSETPMLILLMLAGVTHNIVHASWPPCCAGGREWGGAQSALRAAAVAPAP